jgi:hypothetical protein
MEGCQHIGETGQCVESRCCPMQCGLGVSVDEATGAALDIRISICCPNIGVVAENSASLGYRNAP